LGRPRAVRPPPEQR